MNKVKFDQELIQRYGGRGPRYTSYPTAVQFHSGFGEQDYREAVERTNAMPIPDPLSIYVHIPFCHSLCYYCGCTKIVTRNQERAERYLVPLFQDLEFQAGLFDIDRQVQQLHLGGGTPTYLSPEQMARLMEKLRQNFTLRLDGQQEFSIEIDPRTASPEDIAGLGAVGFNRVSLGVQDFNPEVQKAVNRVQSEEETQALITAARQSGFNSVSLDLIYGLSLQTVETFDRTLDTVLEMRPDRLAIYSYAHLPQMFRAQKLVNEDQLPSPEVKLEILRLTIERLTGAGYVYIGMDHFALASDELVLAQQRGELQRNFQGYSTHARCDLIGLGMSAIGHVGDSFSQNVKDLGVYTAMLDRGQAPIERGYTMSDDDRLRAKVIQEVMCHGKLDFKAISDRFDIDFDAYFAAEIPRLQVLDKDGLIELESDKLRVTDRGRLLLRPIAMVFDYYLQHAKEQPRFSKVI
ncbi:MAG: oxygen-independent coproporphyrinogen III oxidase [Gammaproteobacteria bacterium]|nr:oxygen-independent coproporphyrinogen III oxidase [Gammaproteobacteria bacterium]